MLDMLTMLGGIEFTGAEVTVRTGLASGTVYPILARLEKAGWMTSSWEDVDPRDVGRPRMRFYRLTRSGYIAVDLMCKLRAA